MSAALNPTRMSASPAELAAERAYCARIAYYRAAERLAQVRRVEESLPQLREDAERYVRRAVEAHGSDPLDLLGGVGQGPSTLAPDGGRTAVAERRFLSDDDLTAQLPGYSGDIARRMGVSRDLVVQRMAKLVSSGRVDRSLDGSNGYFYAAARRRRRA